MSGVPPGVPQGAATPAVPAVPAAIFIAISGALSLATAMGIGRFAFTPLLPMMLHDGVIDLPSASWLASANYLGYLLGALFCTFQPLIWRRFPVLPAMAASTWVRSGLVATCVLTLGMALHLPALWPLLRFLAGIASAVVFVFSSGWCMAQLAKRHRSELGGVMFTGPGAGIALSGLFASGMVALNWTAAAGWLLFGLLAIGLVAFVWRVYREPVPSSPPAAPLAATATATVAATAVATPVADHVTPAPQPVGRLRQMLLLALAYGLAGFGYIITATFLPVIAREALPGSAWLDLFWPLFGFGVILGALLSTRMRMDGDMRYLLAGCYFVQAVGVASSLVSPSLAGFAIGSLLLGIPFTAITFFALQEVRRLRPASAPSFMGLLTAVYGIGQIAGPPLVAVILRHSTSLGAGFTLSLEIAAATLLAGAVMYLWMARIYPMPRAPRDAAN
ncbi:MAG: YbfB/YjiJ family MFS transporter [Comamonadaceae bacterium]|nr:MAG: YbfB/YjiJ family MFS transporter [Comamonadaceae bacterium]